MPILADPKLELFKLYQAYDDFESQPLHGTFLIDAAGKRPLPADLGRSVPRRRIHQGRGRAGEPDHGTLTADNGTGWHWLRQC